MQARLPEAIRAAQQPQGRSPSSSDESGTRSQRAWKTWLCIASECPERPGGVSARHLITMNRGSALGHRRSASSIHRCFWEKPLALPGPNELPLVVIKRARLDIAAGDDDHVDRLRKVSTHSTKHLAQPALNLVSGRCPLLKLRCHSNRKAAGSRL